MGKGSFIDMVSDGARGDDASMGVLSLEPMCAASTAGLSDGVITGDFTIGGVGVEEMDAGSSFDRRSFGALAAVFSRVVLAVELVGVGSPAAMVLDCAHAATLSTADLGVDPGVVPF